MKLHFYMHWIVFESATIVANKDKLYTFFCCCCSWYKYKYRAAKEEVITIGSAPSPLAHSFALRSVVLAFHVLRWKGRSPSLVVFLVAHLVIVCLIHLLLSVVAQSTQTLWRQVYFVHSTLLQSVPALNWAILWKHSLSCLHPFRLISRACW